MSSDKPKQFYLIEMEGHLEVVEAECGPSVFANTQYHVIEFSAYQDLLARVGRLEFMNIEYQEELESLRAEKAELLEALREIVSTKTMNSANLKTEVAKRALKKHESEGRG